MQIWRRASIVWQCDPQITIVQSKKICSIRAICRFIMGFLCYKYCARLTNLQNITTVKLVYLNSTNSQSVYSMGAPNRILFLKICMDTSTRYLQKPHLLVLIESVLFDVLAKIPKLNFIVEIWKDCLAQFGLHLNIPYNQLCAALFLRRLNTTTV